ncbi:MAG: DUF5652 family protein [Patescibacteria group bacterium]
MYSSFFSQSPWFAVIMVVLAIWTIPWKGVALWKAARQGSKAWFIVLLIINTVSILDILYIFIFSKTKKKIEPVA